MPVKFDLSSPRAYRASALRVVQQMLTEWARRSNKPLGALSNANVRRDLRTIQRYPHMEKLRLTPRDSEILPVSDSSLTTVELMAARDAYLGGSVLIEDMAAGDGNRLRLGNKYVLLPRDLQQGLAIENEARATARTSTITGRNTILTPRVEAERLQPLSIGTRHKLQFAFDLRNLAVRAGLNPREVLKSQFVLTVLNEKVFNEVIREIIKYNYFGFHPERMLFMVQTLYPGMDIENGRVRFNPTAPAKLWNHGDVVMSETLDHQIFRARFNRYGEIERIPLSTAEFEAILAARSIKLSYPIEDLDFLTGSISLPGVALALDFGQRGYDMVMELTGQRPHAEFDLTDLARLGVSDDEAKMASDKGWLEPSGGKFKFRWGLIPAEVSRNLRQAWLATIEAQGGGVWAFDDQNEGMNRSVVLETDTTGEIIDPGEDTKDTLTRVVALNRNFNMFPHPVVLWRRLREQGLMPHLEVDKESGFIYLIPPQGDQSFLGRTVMIRREPLQPIRSLKYPFDIPPMLEAMAAQDAQADFLEFAQSYGALPAPGGRIVFTRTFVPNLDRLADRAAKSPAPLPIASLNDDIFLSSLNGRGQDHLRAALEFCETIGSEVFRFQVKPGGEESFDSIAGTQKGLKIAGFSPKFPKQAGDAYVGLNKDGQVYISILSHQSHNEGEAVVLYVEVKGGVPPERLKELFRQKFEIIKGHLADTGAADEAIWQALLALPLKELFALRATKLAQIVEAKLPVVTSP